MASTDRLIPDIVRLLVMTARIRDITTYTEIAKHVGTHHRPLRYPLWKIHDRCVANGWPPLTAVVCRKDTRMPSDGFLSQLVGTGCKHEQESRWRELLEEVYNFDWGRARNWLHR